MKISPQHLSRALTLLTERVTTLEDEKATLIEGLEYLKDIVKNTMLKNNPDFKRYKVLAEMDNFLGQKIGRTRTPN
jgi:hypothetical protein